MNPIAVLGGLESWFYAPYEEVNMRTPGTRTWDVPAGTILDSRDWERLAERVTAKFVEFMEEEWKKRVEVVATLQGLKSKVRLNRIQCTHIIDIYSTLEVLTLHPENYLDIIEKDELNIDDEDVSHAPVSFQIIDEDTSALKKKITIDEDDVKVLETCTSSLRALFLELNKIMRHGEILVRECACEDWIGGALTKMTTTPKNDWGIVTPYFHHLQKLEWILNAIGRGIEEFWSLSYQDPVSSTQPFFENEFKVFAIPPPSSEVDVERDRQLLLDDVLEYLNMPPSSENERESEEKQIATFIEWRLQDNALSLADTQSNESSDATFTPTCEAERFGRNQMTLIDVLGHGGYSLAVYRKMWLGIKVAVKELKFEEGFSKEVEFAGLQHPNIVQVLDHWIGERPQIVMELMDRDLYSFMEKHFKNNCPPLSWAIAVMHQLAEALQYLEDNKVIHRDLKSLNVLVRQCPCKEDGCIIVKLADFGTSKHSPAGAEFMTVVGTSGWMAPEVPLEGRVGLGYTTAADVFSFAITCSEILTGKVPFDSTGYKLKKEVREGLRPKLPADCPSPLKAYVQRCWALDPEERPQHFSEICEFLLYCKEKMLRESLSIDDNDVKVLLTHFGIARCLTSCCRLSPAYKRIMDVIHDDTWEELKDLTGSVILEAADFFGKWSDEQHMYERATDILQRWEGSPSSNAEITWRLGYCFELGLGVSQNIDKAVSLYKKACLLDPKDASACVELGRCYATGRGVEKDLNLASKYWVTAGECKGNLKSINEQMTILSYAHYDNCRKARQRICELTATKSGKRLLTSFGVNPDHFTSNLKLWQRKDVWTVANHTTGMWGLVAASVAGMFTCHNEKGKIRLLVTCGRLLVLCFLVSRMGLPTLLVLRPKLPLLGLEDFLLVFLLVVGFVSVVHSKVSEIFRTPDTVLEEDFR